MDDRPAYPCCCFVRAEFSGCFDRAALEAAIRANLRQHPLLTARVARRGRRLTWVPVEDPQPAIEWRAGPVDDKFPPATRIDLTAETGIRFQVVFDGSACALFIQFHHAVCDGVGIFQFLHELLIEYATAVGSPVDQQPVRDFDRWHRVRREMCGFPIAKRLAMAPRQLLNLWVAQEFLRRLPSALLPYRTEPHDSPAPDGYPAAIRARLTPEETAGLQRAARKLAVTLNDLLLRDTFLACHEWRNLQGSHRAGEWLRLAVPMNLRGADDQVLPASNVVSMVFLDRCDLNFNDPDALLAGVRHEMNRNKRRQMNLMLSLAVALGRRLPGGLKKHMWANKCLASSVLSNLGKMFENSSLKNATNRLVAGGATLESVEMLPPIRPHMPAGFMVGTYADRLWITLHFDPRPLKKTQAQDLMAIFLRHIRSSIDSPR